ncbi:MULTISPECIES: Xaa-Pro peptidase family protein [unclassified Mesorhizobium]|uniref:M24 family metallopeptidase n=1 Tax=unclassified Mesorhizobium TaxID=325217 RepID=UPI000FCAC976|nr:MULTISPECIES: Xaa-Pro peptidase family protein [unclassified Mesorhizobium]RUX94148.1 M24 family metallopeptidase [Mesorhizobium sp. M7D.F.Ca.US.004.01.2.1]RVA27034.1 M24 family metallopeptidase [Mesorhizobium sp. M7D.F.Ca.US.004.03.1.1]
MPKAFEKSEFVQRLVRVKRQMVSAGIDVLCVANPANIDYMTGYNVNSYSNIQAVIVDLSDDQPHWLGRFMDTGGALELTYLDQDHVHHYVDSFVDAVDKHPFDAVVALITSRGLGSKRIGVEKQTFFMQPRSVEVLQAELPNATITDASSVVNWVRTVKTPAELEYIRQAGILTDLGIVAAYEAIQVGLRGSDAAAEILYALTKGTKEYGGFSTHPLMMPTGREFSKTYHTSWSDARYEANTSTGLEFSANRHRYSAPLARTVYLGKPPEDFLRAASIMIEGLDALVDGLKAGMTGEEGERLWRDVAIRQGVDKDARIGYAVGLEYPPTWGEQTISLRPGETRLLQEGMVIHLIPSLMSGDWGLEISETVIIGASGATRLSKLAPDVVIKS